MQEGKQELGSLTTSSYEERAELDYRDSSFTFPQKLFHILSSGKWFEYIRWKEDGVCFEILNKKTFIEDVASLYFKCKSFLSCSPCLLFSYSISFISTVQKWPSFQRQLNVYGFRKRNPQNDHYFHPLFCRDRPDLLLQMKRSKQLPKNSSPSKKSALSRSLESDEQQEDRSSAMEESSYPFQEILQAVIRPRSSSSLPLSEGSEENDFSAASPQEASLLSSPRNRLRVLSFPEHNENDRQDLPANNVKEREENQQEQGQEEGAQSAPVPAPISFEVVYLPFLKYENPPTSSSSLSSASHPVYVPFPDYYYSSSYFNPLQHQQHQQQHQQQQQSTSYIPYYHSPAPAPLPLSLPPFLLPPSLNYQPLPLPVVPTSTSSAVSSSSHNPPIPSASNASYYSYYYDYNSQNNPLPTNIGIDTDIDNDDDHELIPTPIPVPVPYHTTEQSPALQPLVSQLSVPVSGLSLSSLLPPYSSSSSSLLTSSFPGWTTATAAAAVAAFPLPLPLPLSLSPSSHQLSSLLLSSQPPDLTTTLSSSSSPSLSKKSTKNNKKEKSNGKEQEEQDQGGIF
jgi:hypothetical protein